MKVIFGRSGVLIEQQQFWNPLPDHGREKMPLSRCLGSPSLIFAASVVLKHIHLELYFEEYPKDIFITKTIQCCSTLGYNSYCEIVMILFSIY